MAVDLYQPQIGEMLKAERPRVFDGYLPVELLTTFSQHTTMKKTPIKVPGKNTRDRSKVAVLASKALVSHIEPSDKYSLTSSRTVPKVALSN